MTSVSPQWQAVRVITEDPDVQAVFREFRRAGGKGSGWALVRSVHKEPKSVESALAKLRDLQVVDSQGSGLDATYSLTKLGFSIYDYFDR